MNIVYVMSYKEDSSATEKTSKEVVLLIRDKSSLFETSKQYRFDSIKAVKPSQFASSDYDFMVSKNYENNTSYVYKSILRDFYKIPAETTFDWKIENEKLQIGPYSCQKASLNYKGRHWVAWFTNDIPIQDGPYIFKGLPGLIISMKDSSGSYEFLFKKLKKDSNTQYFPSKEAMEISNADYKKVMINHYNDPYREMKGTNVKVTVKDENGNLVTPDFRKLTQQAQKSLKKNNNPIELSDAIRYPD
ncbi:GLPGLI family protein [Chryseobacterium sp. CT-SW4]|uniref:GLPGLI family protein n=1 Tax=Chryseobacterium sp. SW-1 TaxID=3157343 RepID=UPI003B023F97